MSIATTWGTTAGERALPYPCDGLTRARTDAYFRGITVHAPPEIVFRWLCQLRAAPYSYDWIDNLGRRSPRELTPGLDDLAVGQRVMTMFRLASFARPIHITVRALRARWLFGEVAVSYMIVPGEASCRLLGKIVVQRRGVLSLPMRLLLPWGDLIMMRKQLMTLRDLAERDAAS